MGGNQHISPTSRVDIDSTALSETLIAATAAHILRELQGKADLWRNVTAHICSVTGSTDQGQDICFGPKCPKTRATERQIEEIVRTALGTTATQTKYSTGGLAPWQLRKVVALIDAMLDQPIVLKTIAEAVGLSLKHFARAFRVSTGISPHRWILSQRVERARYLLSNTNEPICVVAQMCGFADQSHMTATFRKLTGATPGTFRRAKLDDYYQQLPEFNRLQSISNCN